MVAVAEVPVAHQQQAGLAQQPRSFALSIGVVRRVTKRGSRNDLRSSSRKRGMVLGIRHDVAGGLQ